jgi:iron(III) transport system substrate-binding protein
LFILVLSLNIPSDTASAEKSVLLYTSVPSSLLRPLRQSFAKANPDLALRVFRARASTVNRRLADEWHSNHPLADVIWAGDTSQFITYKNAGRLVPYSPPGAASIPADLKDSEGAFHALRLMHLIIAYKPHMGLRPPKGWGDLTNLSAKKEIALRVAMPSPEKSGASLAGIFAWQQNPALGWRFVSRLIAGHPLLTDSFGDTAKVLDGKEIVAAVLADFIAYPSRKVDPAIHILWPVEGAVTIAGPAGIVKKEPANPGAQHLMDFLTSKRAQRIIRGGGLYAARADVPPPEGRPALGQIKRLAPDWEAFPTAEQNILSRVRAMASMAQKKTDE